MSSLFEHFRFAQPQWLLLFLPCLLLLVLRRGRGAEAAISFSSLSVLVSLGAKVRHTAFSLGLPLLFAALVPAILAMARPVWRNELQAKTASGIDIVVALDVSLSMSINDFLTPERRPLRRIDAAKEVVHDFISGRPDDRIGLVIYSGQPYVTGPITLDHSWLLSKLRDVQLEILSEQGTAIGSAIATSAGKLNARNAKSKIIVLITDGASNSGKLSPVEAAEHCKTLGIKIYTVAIGTKEGRVVGIQRFPRQEFDIPTLTKISALTGAEHYWAQNVAALKDTFQTIDRLEKSESKTQIVIEDDELFPWFAGAAVLLAMAGAVVFALNPPPAP